MQNNLDTQPLNVCSLSPAPRGPATPVLSCCSTPPAHCTSPSLSRDTPGLQSTVLYAVITCLHLMIVSSSLTKVGLSLLISDTNTNIQHWIGVIIIFPHCHKTDKLIMNQLDFILDKKSHGTVEYALVLDVVLWSIILRLYGSRM